MTRPNEDHETFGYFVAGWNTHQGHETPAVHLEIANFLEEWWYRGDHDILMMAFRGCGKSTLAGLFCAWVLARNADLRILVLSADDRLAMRMVRNVRRIIEHYSMCQHLVPDLPDQWATDRFTVSRITELRDPSMVAAGITGNITGMRADLMICDDVEVPNTSDTADKRAELRTRLQELNFIKSPGGRMMYVGTPHAFDTIYATEVREDLPGHVPFLAGFKALRIPVLDQQGASAWPEKFSPASIEALRARVGPSLFQSQMMLQPVQLTRLHLDPALLQIYDHDVIYTPEIGQTHIGKASILSGSAWWDPALATGTGDASVLAVVFTGSDGHVYLHHLEYIKVDASGPDDSATAQCKVVAGILKRFRVPVMGLETNGLGQLLPGILRRQMATARAFASVIEVNHRDAKETRIIRAFETLLAARMIHIHGSIVHTRLIDEMRDFRVGRKPGRDDGLDAAAGAITMEPIRLPPFDRPRAPWRVTHTMKGST